MKVDRLMSIALVLLEKKRISAQALADMFEVSLRTIYRDIDAIDLAGIPIRSISGVGGGFEIMPNYKINQHVFSTADLSAILIGLSSFSTMMQKDEYLHALTKVKHLIPEENAKEIDFKVNQVHMDFTQWMGNTDMQRNLEIIKEALQDSKLLSFAYIAHHGNIGTRTMEPYQLVWKSGHWYLYGYCHKRMDYRLFRLTRMTNLRQEEATFIQRDYPKLQLDTTTMFTTIQSEIKLRIHKSILDRVLEYCSLEHFSREDDTHYIVRFPFIENEYHYDMLLGFGNQCECLAPAHVRLKLKDRLQSIVSLYEKGG